MRLPLNDFRDYLADAVAHYEKTAPPVADYPNDLYVRIGERPDTVRLVELTAAGALFDETWEQPNHAANRFYKLAASLGRDVTGLAGF